MATADRDTVPVRIPDGAEQLLPWTNYVCMREGKDLTVEARVVKHMLHMFDAAKERRVEVISIGSPGWRDRFPWRPRSQTPTFQELENER